MEVGITGYRGSGKTTVYNSLTGSSAATGFGGSREANRGRIKVPDDRIDKLSALFKPKKTTFADISFVDVPGPPEGEDGIDKQGADVARKADALVHVIRGFESDQVPPRKGSLDPARDLADFDMELTLLDLVVLETRLERLRKETKKTPELEILEHLVAAMEGGEKPARLLELDAATETALSGFQLLSLKPMLALLSLSDDIPAAEAAALEEKLVAAAKPRGISVMALRPNIEKEIADLPPEDQKSFLDDLGLTETGRPRFIRACYDMLALISFFTVGEDEVKAWTIERGTPAVRAAGKIHSDLERGFIRAETVAYDDFIPLGKIAKARDAGKLRLEGKEYVVQDGDIINIRFNV
jgi:ribosome-binding ATPase